MYIYEKNCDKSTAMQLRTSLVLAGIHSSQIHYDGTRMEVMGVTDSDENALNILERNFQEIRT